MELTVSNLGELLAAIAAILTAMFGGIRLMMYMSNKPLNRKIESIRTDNNLQHDKIFVTLAAVEDSVVRKNIIDELRGIARGYIHYNKGISNDGKVIIDSQCERTVEVVEEMMDEKFTQELLDQSLVKMEIGIGKGEEQARNIYGDEFANYYGVIQKKAINELTLDMQHLVKDAIINSKYARFKSIVMAFLHQLISETALLIHQWEKEHSI